MMWGRTGCSSDWGQMLIPEISICHFPSSPNSPSSYIEKKMVAWNSNEHVLINSKTIPFDSTLHVRDYLFLSYESCFSSPFPVSVPGLEPQDKLSLHPSAYSFQRNLIPTISYLIQGNQCCWDLQKFSWLNTSVLPWAPHSFLLLYCRALLRITST